MTREELAKKRERENKYYAGCLAYFAALFFGTFGVHLMGCAARGGHGFGGEILFPFVGVALFYVVKHCEGVKKC